MNVQYIPALSQNIFFNQLFEVLSSENATEKRRSQNYFEWIHSFNCAFAMLSSEAKIDETVAQDVYHFKIDDTFYHRAGPLTADNNHDPVYAQLYFYDVDTSVNYRMRANANVERSKVLMFEISQQ